MAKLDNSYGILCGIGGNMPAGHHPGLTGWEYSLGPEQLYGRLSLRPNNC